MGYSRGHSTRSGCTLVFLALVACITLGYRVLGYPIGEQQSAADEITLERQKVFFKFENGSTFSLMLDLDDTVRDLNEEIYDFEGVPVDLVKLRVGDTELRQQDAKLSDCNIRGGTTVSLVLPEHVHRKTAIFIVTSLDGREMYVESRLNNSVSSLKDTITQLSSTPQAEQRLLLRGKPMRDERKLAEYGIKSGSRINLGRPLEDCNQTVAIYVKALGGALIKVEVNLADTVVDMKEKIATKTGIPAGVQHLSTNQRSINGIDHLCDIGLEAGAIVFMYLHTPRVTSPDQVARLRTESPHRAPIFREAQDEVDEATGSESRAIPLFRDTRNWVAQEGPRPSWILTQFNPVAHLEPNPDSEGSITVAERTAERLSRTGAEESDRLEVEILRAKIKLSSAVRPYRVAANLILDTQHSLRRPGLSLAGGLADDSSDPKQPIPLGADVNNWAPDAFTDSDLMRLFEVSERVRQVLARDAQTGEGILSIAGQRQINNAILMTYLEALAGYPRSIEYNRTTKGEEDCRICRDDLAVEPAIELPCEHRFHADCIHQWVTSSYLGGRYPSCPYCGKRFMFVHEVLGKLARHLGFSTH